MYRSNTVMDKILPIYNKICEIRNKNPEIYSSFSDGIFCFNKRLAEEYDHVSVPFRATNTYVRTPNNTLVPAEIKAELTDEEKKKWSDLNASMYPQAVKVGGETAHFNCHSYAWYSQDINTNIYWIRDPSAFWEDGSYTVSNCAVNRKVRYLNGVHSAIVYMSGSTPVFKSKWGEGGLYIHAATYGPVYGYNQGVRYYE